MKKVIYGETMATKYVPPHRRKRNDDDGVPVISSSSSEPQSFMTRKPSGTRVEESVKTKLRDQGDVVDDGRHDFRRNVDLVLPQFTRICCINLREREDRWQTFCRRMCSALRLHDDINTTITSTGTRRWRGGGGCGGSETVGDSAGGHFNSHAQAAREFFQKVERFEAVNGSEVLAQLSKEGEKRSIDGDNDDGDGDDNDELPRLEWDATQNSRYDRHVHPPYTKRMSPGEVGCAMSHVRLWKQIAAAVTVESNDDDDKNNCNNKDDSDDDKDCTMLILEDDATFYTKKKAPNQQIQQCKKGWQHGQGNNRRGDSRDQKNRNGIEFIDALSAAWKILPSDWDILYLGFSDRGERHYVESVSTSVVVDGDDDDDEDKDNYNHRSVIDPSSRNSGHCHNNDRIHVKLFRPTYGFHTHAYVLKSRSASVLLSNLPVNGPLDVWLSDNQWFGLNVYCAIVDGEGWKKTGANLVSQRKHDTRSDIHQSGR